jgi:hypothetical protein
MGVWGVTGIRGIALPPQELHRPMTACAVDSRSVRRLELRNLPAAVDDESRCRR